MNLQQVFEYLQDHKVCKLQLPDHKAAESLRIMLTKKWTNYKKGLDKLGFLDENTRHLAISLEAGKVNEDNTQEFIFHLRPRSRTKVEYKILPIDGDKDG